MAYDYAKPLEGNPYDQLRQRAINNAQNSGAQGMDAITRRYAAMGNLNSGSYTKGLQDINRSTQEAQENGVGAVNAQEAQNAIPFAMQEKQQGFQGEQARLGREQQQKQFDVESAQKSRQLDLEASQQNLDQWANQMNADLAGQQMDRSGGLLGGGGVLGTGIGGHGGGLLGGKGTISSGFK